MNIFNKYFVTITINVLPILIIPVTAFDKYYDHFKSISNECHRKDAADCNYFLKDVCGFLDNVQEDHKVNYKSPTFLKDENDNVDNVEKVNGKCYRVSKLKESQLMVKHDV
ncbi:uncharacterized protein LOC113560360 [Rhopalosiphum maidis]|uniref:uncharacterized protein LOC113560360 n=1 Tax=Rhopalosiphum maidis TaxID=43146 RepID=UPI000EFFBDF0|nr:uncharacterized protein LOC113560360 [Rhopalosiphum maidis]